MMKTALVLGGGGSKGAYEIGVWKAIKELNIPIDIVTGTSIGSLIGVLFVQGDYEQCYDLWSHITVDDVVKDGINLDMDMDLLMSQKDRYKSIFKDYVNHKGADITPFIEMIAHLYDEQRFYASPIDYGCMSVNVTKRKAQPFIKKEMRDIAKDAILASASCFPAFPMTRIQGDLFIDGGYYDNVPIELARSLGAEKVIAVDLRSVGHNQIKEPQEDLIYIEPHVPLGSFLLFDHDLIMRNIELGYYDTMKKFDRYLGYLYTFSLNNQKAVTSLEAGFDSFLSEMDINILQPTTNKLSHKLLKHQISVSLKQYDSFHHMYLRLLEEVAITFHIQELHVYDELATFIQHLHDAIELYSPSYDGLFDKRLSAKDIAQAMKTFSHKDIMYYFYQRFAHMNEENRSELKYLALAFHDEFMLALMAYYAIDIFTFVIE